MKKFSLAIASLIVIGLMECWAQGRTAREQTIINVFGRLNLTVDPYNNLNSWTDGSAVYRPFFTDLSNLDAKPRANGDTIYFHGGTLHEGGFSIKVLLDAAGKMKVAADDYPFKKGDVMEYRTIGGKTLLILKDTRTGSVKEVLKKFDGNLYNRITGNYRRYILSGKYIDAGGNSRNIVFALDKSAVSGFRGSGERTYNFAEIYETPDKILLFGDKEAYEVTKILIGLELRPMKIVREEWDETSYIVDKSKPVIQLNKAAEIVPGLSAGRFPLASVEVMTLTELELYAGEPKLPNLQVMRNEIYARYGYKFKAGGEMDGYFCTQDWYTPQYDDVASKLTEIERINIALIQVLEKKK